MNLDSSNKEYFRKIDYELNMEKYRQLHNVVLKFSNNSMEIKKLFATAIGGTIAFFIPLMNKKSYTITTEAVQFIIIAIILLFYIVDSYTYFYQKKLRGEMEKIENKIKHQDFVTSNQCNTEELIFKALINWSHLPYYIVFAITIMSPYFLKGFL